MSILDRFTSPTPSFFTTLRNIGLALAAAGTAVLGAQELLPGLLVKIAGYIVVAGSVMSAVSQATVTRDK